MNPNAIVPNSKGAWPNKHWRIQLSLIASMKWDALNVRRGGLFEHIRKPSTFFERRLLMGKGEWVHKTLVNELKGEMSHIYMTFFIEKWGIFNGLCFMNFIGRESTHHKAQDKQPHELKNICRSQGMGEGGFLYNGTNLTPISTHNFCPLL